MKKRILIIGASFYQKYIYEKAKENDFFILGVDKNPNSPMFQLCDDYKSIDIFDVNGVLAYANKMKVDAVATINIDQGMNAVSAVQRKLNLPALSEDVVLFSTSKDLMREVWKMNNVNIPDYWIFHEKNFSDIEKLIKQIDKKLIIKPVDNAAKRGISVISKKDSYLREKIENAFVHSKNNTIIIEEFIEGDLYFAPTYIFKDGNSSIGLIKQEYNENLVQIKYTAPVEIDDNIKQQIISEAHKAASCFGFGPFHTEIIFSEERGAVLVETSPRVSYATVALTRLINNFDPVAAIINDACDLNLNTAFLQNNAKTAILEHVIPNKGSRFIGLNQNEFEHKGIYEVTPVVEKGHITNEFKTNADRVLYFVTYANSNKELTEITKNLKTRLIKECFI